jgi:hypothetical protein
MQSYVFGKDVMENDEEISDKSEANEDDGWNAGLSTPYNQEHEAGNEDTDRDKAEEECRMAGESMFCLRRLVFTIIRVGIDEQHIRIFISSG